MKKILNILNIHIMPYDLNNFYFISLAICFVHSYLFIAFLKPFEYFGLNEYSTVYYALGYATVNFINEFIMIALFSKVFVKFSENWTFGKDSMFWLIMLATVSFSQLIAIHYSDNIPITFANFFKMLGVIIVVGIIPFFVFVITKFIISRKNHIEKFNSINKGLKYKLKVYNYNRKSNDTEFHIVGMNKNDLFKFKEKDFYYASSDENYVHIFFEFDSQIEKLTFRISLISLIRQLSTTENILQCHKSYVVNKTKIVSIEGSTRGYRLYLKNVEKSIPIGLKYYDDLTAKTPLAKN
jgi:hypothetical protein